LKIKLYSNFVFYYLYYLLQNLNIVNIYFKRHAFIGIEFDIQILYWHYLYPQRQSFIVGINIQILLFNFKLSTANFEYYNVF
jgi:hypothetical protein